MILLSSKTLFSDAKLALAGFPLTKALGEYIPSRNLKMFNYAFVMQQPFGIP